jgi:CRP-like cAMP-binding protein
MLVDDLRSTFLAARLSDTQLAELLAVGEERSFRTGDELFEEGRPADLMWILLGGEVELSRRSGRQRVAVATMSTPG